MEDEQKEREKCHCDLFYKWAFTAPKEQRTGN